jgi:Holliday junction DNA helicase RuvA
VREDGWTLYGFDSPAERTIFQRLLSASGLGPRLALAILSTLGPERAVRSIQGKDIAALSTVSGIGRKRAEKLAVELSDRFADVPVTPANAGGRPADEAVRALTALGYSPAAADQAVRTVLVPSSSDGVQELVRRALQQLAPR